MTIIAISDGSPSLTATSDAASVNLAFGILFRQEQVVNALFWILTSIPRSSPLWLRVQAARIFHYGGFHSGCGVAAVSWFLLYTALATKSFINSPSSTSIESLVTAWILVAIFAILLGGAYPKFRMRYHNHFEMFHRFAGWAALAVFWAHVLFTAHSDGVSANTYMGHEIVRSVPFWAILISTMPVVLSWGQLRRRTVRVEALSDHATRLCFDYAGMPPCYGVRVSTNPLLEWHSFATIPDTGVVDNESPSTSALQDCSPIPTLAQASSSEPSSSGIFRTTSSTTLSASTIASQTSQQQSAPSQSSGSKPTTATPTAPRPQSFSIVVSNAGDWTNHIIQTPPSHLYIRGSPLRGVIYSARLFSRVLLIATGSGIGPCLSLLVDHARLLPARPRVLWSAPAPASTFGPRIMREVRRADPDALVWDTRSSGRPDLLKLALQLVCEIRAEAVFVISNPKVCDMLVRGLVDQGVPGFAPIFDS